MKTKIYAIYDSKTESYAQPNFLINKGTFTRALMEALNDPQSNLSKYPADFTAFEIGEWDDQTAHIQMHPAKINLGNLLEFKAYSPPMPNASSALDERVNSQQTMEQ